MPEWLDWAQRLRAIAQTGRAYTKDPYDAERYEELSSIAVKMLAALTKAAPERLEQLFIGQGYPTPKIDVRAGVFRQDEILLVRETSDGLWSLPGGWADETDTPSIAAEREVLEESGYTVEARHLVSVRDRNMTYPGRRLDAVYKLFFLCELISGEPALSIEVSEVGFFPLTDLPPLSLGRTLPRDIEDLNARRVSSHQQTIFD